MKLAKNSEELKELFLKGQKLCKTDVEIDNFTRIKDEKKKEFVPNRIQHQSFDE
jgi:hypothetical protein